MGKSTRLPRLALLLPIIGLVACPLAALTHQVAVNPDGTFTPQQVTIGDGDTVMWLLGDQADTIIPINDSLRANCADRKTYEPSDPNEFTGPMPDAPSGIFTLSPIPLKDALAVDSSGSCPPGTNKVAEATNGTNAVLCKRAGVSGETMNATWQSPNLTGVFIRLLWKDVNPALGSYDFVLMDSEIDKAVANGKLYSLGFKAGGQGTPDWIFRDGSITRLALQGTGDPPTVGNCGVPMHLGNPADPDYQAHYLGLLKEVADHLKARNKRYRALAYIKISGANEFSHENRLPKYCATDVGCTCNTELLANDGYRPAGLYGFYAAQMNLLAKEFPGKAMAYALIQEGFPLVNYAGGYEQPDGTSSDGVDLPGRSRQTQTILDMGQGLHPSRFVVQHNGLRPRPDPGVCPNFQQHPVPLLDLDCNGPTDTCYEGAGSSCPNKWVLREGAEGQITGFQTTNTKNGGPGGVYDLQTLDQALLNAWDNSDAVFVEIYEERFWEAENASIPFLGPPFQPGGRDLGDFKSDFESRRPPIPLARPLPPATGGPGPVHEHTFTNISGAAEDYEYINGSKCNPANNVTNYGKITVQKDLKKRRPNQRMTGAATRQ